MDGARDVADEAIQWHREKFHQFRSYTERDVGWTVQTRIRTISAYAVRSACDRVRHVVIA